eukprot:4013803-Alexandrium_andersonii.AAC.1
MGGTAAGVNPGQEDRVVGEGAARTERNRPLPGLTGRGRNHVQGGTGEPSPAGLANRKQAAPPRNKPGPERPCELGLPR